MLLFASTLLAAVTAAAEPAPTVEALMALPETRMRLAALAAFLASGSSDADAIAGASVAHATLSQLEAHARTDPSVVRWFLLAALSADPAQRAAALAAASVNGDPPLPAGALPGSAADEDLDDALDPSRIRAYRGRYLHEEQLTILTSETAVLGNVATSHVVATVGWAIFEGGAPLRVPALAEVLGDDRLRDQLHARNTVNVALGIVGWTAVVAGAGMALAASEDPSHRMPLYYGGLAVILAGIGPAIVPFHAKQKRSWAGKFYARDALVQRTDAFNEDLQQELGLSDAEVIEAESGD